MVWTYLQNEQREWPSMVHNWKPTGKRPVGRPKQRRMDNKEKDLKSASLSLYGITTGRNRVRLESWLETEKGGRTSLQHPWPDGPLG